jgi:hypothetical protein
MAKTTVALALCVAGTTAALSLGACGSSTPDNGFVDGPDTGNGSGDGSQNPADSGQIFNNDAGPQQLPDVQQPPPVAVVYAHGPDNLYKVDPNTKSVTLIGPFQGCSSVIDLAIDGNNNAFVTTFGGLYSLDTKTAKCTMISQGSYPNSLSFVPKGTLDSTKEALVGYVGSTYVRIDEKTGNVTNVGSIGSGYSSSGDIVSVINGGTFLTVNGNNCNDCLLQVDPKTGSMIKNYGSVNHSSVFGLAFWAATLYGFDSSGVLFTINANGNTIKTVDIKIPNAPPNLNWWGAGSTTSAPVADSDGGTIPIN